ncbi:MAG: cysteine--tRNA ligase [Deltaproteobacteria bacterium]|nr:cysteine--tRNA ligase [Deltaproteobacteria bacterium]
MPLRLYNSASRKKELFKPIKEGHVGIYVCGVTVYDVCHIGHARSAIVFDVLVRYLKARGFKVTYVRNFTDVDDKIIERSKQTGEDTTTLAERHIELFYRDMHALGVLDADVEPRATEHIEGMIDMVSRLVDKGYAYVVDGDVYFSVETFDQYGQLSGRNLEDMVAGARIAVDEKKRNPLDFVLWKGAKPGEPKWESPWGEGRPGWHMECSVMACKYLGANFDIHGGGRDLIFPHHENERAQSMAANGVDFANWWVHNGFLTVESEKMSKSLGNFITIQDALASYHPQELRLFLLSTHYRSPLDFSRSGLREARSGIVRIFRTLKRLEELIGPYHRDSDEIAAPSLAATETDDLKRRFIGVMDDDLNTAAALGLLFDKVHELNRLLDSSVNNKDLRSRLKRERDALIECAASLGLLWDRPSQLLAEITKAPAEIDPEQIEDMIMQRDRARKERDWARADSIREELFQKGIILEDGPEGTNWRLRMEKPA